MPRFIDHHATDPNMPPEVVTVIERRLMVGARDQFGELGVNVFVGPRTTYCYTDAPTAEAVRKSHEAMGISLAAEDVEEVQVLP